MPGSSDISDLTPPKVDRLETFSTTQSDAEKASGHPAKYFPTPHTDRKDKAEAGDKAGSGNEAAESNDYEDDKPRLDAKIWSLYLTEAEEEAKQQAELWKTDLESLLLFAGLFAGIVASFVIDSRHDLQPQTKTEVLLADIRNALRSETNPPDMLELGRFTLWINGLWFTSLLITLFSATMGILAKSWVVRFIPVAKGQESKDAYQRWVRDERAKLWYLGPGITILPGLIHLALLLFSIGFGLQSLGDNTKLGWVVLSLVFLGTAIYMGMTAAPFFFPGIPCQTPLSTILKNLAYHSKPKTFLAKYNSHYRHSLLHPPKRNDVLSRIWHTQLAGSGRSSNVDAAIAELTQKKLNDNWWQRFVQWGTPEILRKRLRESMANGFQHDSLEILRDHLRALSGFVDYYKKSDLRRLNKELGVYLDPGNPLHRWNVFPEKIRALAFSVRTPILLACKRDYTASEIEELPWEAMVHNMLPTHRRDFAMAACRGLAGDQERLRKVSALSIVVCIAKATVAAIGPKSEWGLEINKTAKSEAEALGRQYLGKLFEEIAKGWKVLVLENSSKTPSVTAKPDSQNSTALGGLGSELGHWNPRVRTRAIETLLTLAIDNDFKDVVKSSIPELAEIAANDMDQDVRTKGMDALILLAYNEVFQDSAKQALLDSLRFTLEAFEWSREPRLRTIDNIATLVERSDFRTVFPDTAELLIYDLMKLAVDDWNEDVRAAGVTALKSLVNETELQSDINQALSNSLNMDSESPFWAEVDTMERLVALVQDLNLQGAINSEITKLVAVAMSEVDPDIRIAKMKTLASLAQGEILRYTVLPELPKILDIAWDDISSSVHTSWIGVLLFLTDEDKFQNSIKSAIPTLLRMTMNGDNETTHKAGVEALTLLAKNELLRDSIKHSLPNNIELALKSSDWEARVCTLRTLDTLIKDLEIWDTIEAIIQELIHLVVNDDDDDVRTAGIDPLVTIIQGVGSKNLSLTEKLREAFKKSDQWGRVHILDKIGQFLQFRDAMEPAIPSLIELAVDNDDTGVQIAGVKLVGSLIRDGVFQGIAEPTISRVHVLEPKNLHWRVHIAWFELLEILAKNPAFEPSVKVVLPKFIDSLTEDQDEDVRVAGLKSLTSLAQCDEFRDIIKSNLTTMVVSPKEDHWSVRVAWAEMHVTLAQIPDFQNFVEKGIPRLAEMAATDEDEDARIAGINSLVSLAQDEKFRGISSTVRGAIKSALPKSLESASKDAHWKVRMAWISALGLLALSPDFRDNLQSAIPKLVKMTGDDEDNDVRRTGTKALTSLLQDRNLKLQETITLALPKNLDSVFDKSAHGLRAGWCQILDILIHRDLRLGGATETVIPKLVEMAIRNDDQDTRISMAKLLAFLAKEDAKFRDTIRLTLSKSLDSALKTLDWEIRNCAVEALGALVQHSHFQDAVKSAMPQLLKMAINDDDEDVRKAAVELLSRLKSEANRDNRGNISDAIILAVPPTVALVTPAGRDVRKTIDSLLRLSGAPTDPELVRSMAHVLTPMLSGDIWITRATAVEFFPVLLEHDHFRHFIQSAVPGIITLALEDKEDYVRAAGIRSLVSLAGEGVFRDKIKAILPQLILLLEINRLRAPVTELISLLAVDETVRKDVISHLINPLVNLKVGELYPDGLLELLWRLIIDKRFDYQEASDYVALSVASVLLMQPHTAGFRFRTATALWCNYGGKYEVGPQHAVEFPEYLVELFLFTIFGRHVTLDEVNKWRLMGSSLSPAAEPSPDILMV